MLVRPALVVVSLACAAAGAAAAVSLAAIPRPAQDRPLFSSESQLVVLHVTVKDGRGRYVGGLTQDAFTVFEDRVPQAIQLFSGQDAPVTVGLLIDGSGSMFGNRDSVVAASAAFVETSNPQDEVFALAFNEDVRSALPPGERFTSSADALRGALSTAIVARGRTALYDAIASGLRYAATGHHERKILVILSDGGDNASRSTTFRQVMADIQASNVVIYAVGLIDPLERDANPRQLKELGQASGGEAFFPKDISQVTDALRHVAREIRSSYTIGYSPASSAAEPVFRRIHVAVDPRQSRGASVRTRSGYLMEPAAAGARP